MSLKDIEIVIQLILTYVHSTLYSTSTFKNRDVADQLLLHSISVTLSCNIAFIVNLSIEDLLGSDL